VTLAAAPLPSRDEVRAKYDTLTNWSEEELKNPSASNIHKKKQPFIRFELLVSDSLDCVSAIFHFPNSEKHLEQEQ
jgi:hypothetical protein